MLKVDFSDEFTQELANKVVEQLVPILIQELKQDQLPHIMDRKQFMELTGIGETKCSELFHRQDFYPVTRDFGHPKVVTKLFFEWLNEKAGRSDELNMGYPYQAI